MNSDGVLLVDKEAGASSAKVIATLKNNLEFRGKIGHAGTLDPFATGLLVVLLGKATRLADYFQAGEKIYSGEIQFGLSTDSDDITGKEIAKSSNLPDFESLEKTAAAMIGNLEQLPPKISALKIGGQRAYKMARNGQDVKLSPRRVTLSSIELKQLSEDCVSFKIRCSKGFYVRALARDLGQSLNSCACLKTLRREASQPFEVTKARQLSNVSIEHIIPWDQALKAVSKNEIQIEDREYEALKNGLIPHSLSARALVELDSYANALIVYRRRSDGFAGGLLSKNGSEFKIALNM